jgi:hypothetical protein
MKLNVQLIQLSVWIMTRIPEFDFGEKKFIFISFYFLFYFYFLGGPLSLISTGDSRVPSERYRRLQRVVKNAPRYRIYGLSLSILHIV